MLNSWLTGVPHSQSIQYTWFCWIPYKALQHDLFDLLQSSSHSSYYISVGAGLPKTVSKYCGMWVGEEGMKMGVVREVDKVLRHACMHAYTHNRDFFLPCRAGWQERNVMLSEAWGTLSISSTERERERERERESRLRKNYMKTCNEEEPFKPCHRECIGK